MPEEYSSAHANLKKRYKGAQTNAYRVRHDFDLFSDLIHANSLVGIERGAKVDTNASKHTAASDPNDSAQSARRNRHVASLGRSKTNCDGQKQENECRSMEECDRKFKFKSNMTTGSMLAIIITQINVGAIIPCGKSRNARTRVPTG